MIAILSKKEIVLVFYDYALHTIPATLQMLTYGVPVNATEEYIQIGESIIIKFMKAVVEVFGDEYLRSLNNYDTTRLLAIEKERGFLRMLGSIDCMHRKWENCPTTWQSIYTGHVHEPSIILEVVASQDL